MAVTISGDGTLTGVDAAASGLDNVIKQVIQGSSTTSTTITSSSPTTSTLSSAITPTSASSKVLVICSFNVICEQSGNQYFYLYRGTTSGTQLGNFNHNNINYSLNATQSIVWLDSPATTSSTTYTLAGSTDTASMTFQYAGRPSTITLLEVAA